jgi:predicted lipid-binding transport protein (Tim44 family)
LDVQAEQLQANTLLEAIHQLVTNATQAPAPQAQPTPGAVAQPQAMGLMGGMGGGGMGMLGSFLGGGFGRAIEMGAGIGLGQDLIGSIFR